MPQTQHDTIGVVIFPSIHLMPHFRRRWYESTREIFAKRGHCFFAKVPPITFIDNIQLDVFNSFLKKLGENHFDEVVIFGDFVHPYVHLVMTDIPPMTEWTNAALLNSPLWTHLKEQKRTASQPRF